MESQIKDSLYKAFMVAFTHESSHHLLFNEDLIEIALFCLEFWREISIDVKKKLARLISISILIQERLLRKEIISGISHLLEHTSETEMLRHTILACSYLSMNYNFSSSPLSNEIIEKLVPLIPIFNDKDLYILLHQVMRLCERLLYQFFSKIFHNLRRTDLDLKSKLRTTVIVRLFVKISEENKIKNRTRTFYYPIIIFK